MYWCRCLWWMSNSWSSLEEGGGGRDQRLRNAEKVSQSFSRCKVNVVAVLTEHAECQPPHSPTPELIFLILLFGHCCRTTLIWKDPAAAQPAEQASLQLYYINHATNHNKLRKVWMQHFARCNAPIKERPPCSSSYWGFYFEFRLLIWTLKAFLEG